MPCSLEAYAHDLKIAGQDDLPTICKMFVCADDIPILKAAVAADFVSPSTVSTVLSSIFYDEIKFKMNHRGSIVEVSQFELGAFKALIF